MNMDDPPGSRLFIVCGKSVEADVLSSAFSPYGNVQNVKVIRDKGVAYVKYDLASSAALAMEVLNGAVLNNGRGPKLKVLLAEAPTARGVQPAKHVTEQEISSDPDNIPPRSRLFVVVPKQADPQQISDDMLTFQELEYCKTDLIATKGVVFCKFSKASSALRALEQVSARGTLAGYKVKCMLAEPKTKRNRSEGSPEMFSPMQQVDASMGLKLPVGAAMTPSPMGVTDYGTISGLSSLTGGIAGFNALSGVSNMSNLSNISVHSGMDGLGPQVGLGFVGGLGNIQTSTPGAMGLNASGTTSLGSGSSTLSTANFHGYNSYGGLTNAVTPNASPSPTLSKQRLFVVVHKGVGEDMIARLFRRFPGMEYCDLKKDRATGKSKGYAYVNYSTPEAAAAAVDQLNGIEFPPHSGHRLKVMFAEPLGVRNSGSRSPAHPLPVTGSPSPVHTPLSRALTADVAAVQDTLANMSMPHGGEGQNGDISLHDVGHRRITSPVQSTVARELMFSVG